MYANVIYTFELEFQVIPKLVFKEHFATLAIVKICYP